MITLAAPCRALADTEPLTVDRDDLVSEISEDIKDVHYRAAVAVDRAGKPVGLVTRSDLVSPRPRRVLLVDHAEQAQSAPGVEEAEIVEILDHHHIGSIETRIPVRATFDPVGSTRHARRRALPPERDGAQRPGRRDAARGSKPLDTVLLNSPTATERDRAVVDFLESALRVDAMEFGGEMFEAGSDVTGISATSSAATPSSTRSRTATRWRSPRSRSSARASSSAAASCARRSSDACSTGTTLAALMVTDILSKGTDLLVAATRRRSSEHSARSSRTACRRSRRS